MDEIYPKNSWDINVRYIWDIGEICPRCTWDVPETDIFLRYTRDILADIYDIFKRYDWDLSEIYPRYRQYAWDLLLIRYDWDICDLYMKYVWDIQDI